MDDLFSFNYLDPAPEKSASKPKASKPRAEPEERLLSVGQLMKETRSALERQFSSVWVKGEISNFKPHPSGHQYFTLKDAQAQVSCVIWRSQAATLGIRLKDGMEVQVCGDVTVYETRGQLQMTVRKVRQSGLGALQQRFEELKQRLSAEGLFDSERKKAIPSFPKVVAIITASSGAALRDMLHVLNRRAPWVHVLVYSVAVQGMGAHSQIAAAIEYLGQPHAGLPKIDTLVVARGGGSLEDLWSFNEEAVARAIAACPLPVISAVGHEIDFTISDFVADLRAPTPSAAAEILAPDQNELLARLNRWEQTLQFRARQAVQHWRKVLDMVGETTLQRLMERALAVRQQALDTHGEELDTMASTVFVRREQHLLHLAHALEKRSPINALERRSARITLVNERLETRFANRFQRLQQRLATNQALLHSLSPDATMARGYSLTLDKSGKAVRSSKQLAAGDELVTRLADGQIRSVVSGS